MVQCLLDHGADKDKAWETGATPLYMAAEKGHFDVVKCLVEHGADKDKAINDGYTPLQCAAINGHTEVVTYLSIDLKKEGDV